MRAERERVEAVIAGTALAGRPIRVLHVPGSDAVAPAVEIAPHEVRDGWRAAREVVDRLGRWPVAVCAWDDELDGEDLFSRHFHRDEPDPETVIAQARALSFESALARLPEYEDEPGDETSHDEVWDEHLRWYEPHDQPTAIALLPVAAPEEVMAYTSLYEADHAALIAVLRGWRERFGAELVASWGTMLQLTVERPPSDLRAASVLAVEQARVAADTLLLPGISLREHARALVGRDEWFLHSRP